jgi:hypothetical protein
MSRFKEGDPIRIRSQETLFHSRVPAYVKGCYGVIERVLDEFVIPEDDAWGRLWDGGRSEMLYRVQMHQSETWPGYRGPSGDTNEIEMFEHWLEPTMETTT